MFKNLNLPNKLTIFRIILVPIFIIMMAISSINGLNVLAFAALAIYILASVTDFLDGKIARKHGLITDFGKVMDPLADKILVASGFIMLTYLQIVPGWITAIIICRDFFIDGLRMLASMKNIVVPASISGKIKTFFQMTTIVLAILNYGISNYNKFLTFFENGFTMPVFPLLINILMSVCLVGTLIATIVSCIQYIIKFNQILSEDKKEE